MRRTPVSARVVVTAWLDTVSEVRVAFAVSVTQSSLLITNAYSSVLAITHKQR